jgi:hypothetical protein
MRRSLRPFVRERAGGHCEYCQLPDTAIPAALFHVEHIVAKQHRGSDQPSNRCWCCHRCNSKKGPNLSGRDPVTGHTVLLFNPRWQLWRRHFRWMGPILVGRTQTGRATIAVLDINEPQRVQLRRALSDQGEWLEDGRER